MRRIILAMALVGCVCPTGGLTVPEACEQYEAETEGAACEYPCPWADLREESPCDAAQVSACAQATIPLCNTEAPIECATACNGGPR